MRNDVKIVLIGAFVVALGGVAYVFMQKQPEKPTLPTSQDSLLTADNNAPTATTVPSGAGSLLITAPGSLGAATTSQPTTGLAGGGGVMSTAPGSTMPGGWGDGIVRTTPPGGRALDMGPTGTYSGSTIVDTGMGVTTRSTMGPILGGGPTLGGGSTLGGSSILGAGPMLGSSTTAGTYEVKKGDTFSTIAKTNGVTVKALEKANPGVDSSHLKIGQKIKLPAATGTTGTTGLTGTTGTMGITGTTGLTGTTPPRTDTATTRTTATTYTVKKGDTLLKIARSVYGNEKDWKKIAAANKAKLGGDPNDLSVGMVLQIPPK